MVIRYVTKISVTNLTFTDDMVAAIREYPLLMVDYTKVATTRLPRTKVTAVRFASTDKDISSSMPINQESLLLRPARVNQVCAAKS